MPAGFRVEISGGLLVAAQPGRRALSGPPCHSVKYFIDSVGDTVRDSFPARAGLDDQNRLPAATTNLEWQLWQDRRGPPAIRGRVLEVGGIARH